LAIWALDPPLAYKEDVPVLHFRGANDVTSPELGVKAMRKVLPWTKVVTYAGTGHWLMLEKRKEVTRDVLNWLGDIGRKPKL
jgi:pimeloyl-ACP methyl ester carboxylesterase